MKEGIIYLNFHFNPIFAYAFLYLNSDAWEDEYHRKCNRFISMEKQ